MIYFYIKLDI